MDTNGTKPASAVSTSTADSDPNAAADHLLSLLSDAGDDDEGNQPADSGDTGESPEADAGDTADSVSDDAETADDTADGDTAQSDEDPSFTVKVDGEEITVPLSELRAGYSRTADYTRKTTAIAEEKRQFEADSKARDDQYAQEVGRLAQFAQMVVAADPLLAEAQKIDWAKLATDDPIEWARKSGQVQARMATLSAVQQEVERVTTERTKARLREEMTLAQKAIPELADPGKAKALKTEMRGFLTDAGFNDNEIAGIADHRVLKVVREAMEFRRIKGAQATAKDKIKAAASKTLKPNSSERSARNSKQLDAKEQKALRDASLDRAADKIASLL